MALSLMVLTVLVVQVSSLRLYCVIVTVPRMSLCVLPDGEAWLLYSDRFNLWHISTDDSHKNKKLIEMLDYPISMDYHYRYMLCITFHVCVCVCVVYCM